MFYKSIWDYEGYSLVKRPDTPNYYIYWNPVGNRFKRLSTKTRDIDHAKQFLIRFAERRRRPTRPPPESVPLGSVLTHYVNSQLTGKTLRDGSSVLRTLHHFMDAEGIRTVADMTPRMQRHFIEWRKHQAGRKGKMLSNDTINKDLQVLRAALNHCRREGYVSEVPNVQLLSKPPPRQRFLTPEEVRRLLAECREQHLFRFVMLSLHTLQRPGAILGLRCEQVDLGSRRIDFKPPGWIQSNKRRPVVPISNTILPVLEEAIAESVSGFLIEYAGRPVSSIKTSFGKACRRAELLDVIPYTLRHTGATLLAAAGVPLWQVSGMLGHSITRTTEIYAKHSPEYLLAATEGLDRVLGHGTLSSVCANRAPKCVSERLSTVDHVNDTTERMTRGDHSANDANSHVDWALTHAVGSSKRTDLLHGGA